MWLPDHKRPRGCFGAEFLEATPQFLDLRLELQDSPDALEGQAFGGQLRDLTKSCNVVAAVETIASAYASRHDEAGPVVLSKCLRMQPCEFGSDRNRVHRCIRCHRERCSLLRHSNHPP